MMNFIYWTKQEIDLLKSMKDASDQEVADAINKEHHAGTNGFITERTSNAVRRKRKKLAPASTKKKAGVDLKKVDARWETIKNIQKRYKENSKFLEIGMPKGKTRTKILSLSDIHFPFARIDFLTQAITDHADADIVVVNGDVLDGYMVSTFKKDKSVAATDEYMCAFDFVYMLSKKFRIVILVKGNHDVRYEKMLSSAMPDEVCDLYQGNVLARIANGERIDRKGNLIEKVDMSNVFFSTSEQWWVKVGKTLFIHPYTRGSSKPAYTVSGWAKKFKERLTPGSFDCVVAGHTHQISKHIEGSLLLIEQGCLCDYMSYAWQPKEFYHSNAMNGYAVIYQDEDGNTDFNMSGFVYLGQLLPSDKDIVNIKNDAYNKED